MKYSIIILLVACGVAHGSISVCKEQNGGWSEWLRWGPCSVTCGSGVQVRHRYCDNPMPKYGGKPCKPEHGRQIQKCDMEDCPPNGVYFEEKGVCDRKCGGGWRKISYQCKAPSKYGSAKCYTNCQIKEDSKEKCNEEKCENEVRHVCEQCRADADALRSTHGNDFVGFACRVDRSHCPSYTDSDYGIRGMYPANDWFFLHCSPDGPWCKPCATRGLVYNHACGQCEVKRDSACTGPQEWQKKKRDILSDEDLW